jgi:hypothetical protein
MKLYIVVIVVIKGVQNVKYFFKLKAQPLRPSLPKQKTIKKKERRRNLSRQHELAQFFKRKDKNFY